MNAALPFFRSLWLPRLVLSALLCCLGLATIAAFSEHAGHDLLAGKPWHASSEGAKCFPAQHECLGATTDIFFHTKEENDPFIEFELQGSFTVHKLRVENRADSGLQERAVPLVASTSMDGIHWHEVGRRDYWFQTWNAEFPLESARYFRLEVPKKTVLHLEYVGLW